MSSARVYADRAQVDAQNSHHLNDICRAIWNFETSELCFDNFASGSPKFVAVESPENSDIYLLPLKWNYYLENNLLVLVAQQMEQARLLKKRLCIFSEGDYTANLPFDNVTLFERSSYASRRAQSVNPVYVTPAFISDYLQLYCNGERKIRAKGSIPVVGFCGQAGGAWFHVLRRELAMHFRKLAYKLKLRKWEPAPYETTRQRQKILQMLEQHPGIRTNFVVRSNYRAGYLPKVKDPFHPTRLEFIQNVLDSDYTVCVRGNGNFSVRFYEALALGRIPIFVNTDCALPYEQTIDYRQYCVWVEQNEINQIGQKIRDFHQSLSPAQFEDLQVACRQLWLDRLSMNGFYTHFDEYLY